MKKKTGFVLAAAAAGLMASGISTAAFAHGEKASEMVKCEGANSCKGQSDCKGKHNACKGQNACKGKGWMKASDKKECEDKGGKPEKMSKAEEETYKKQSGGMMGGDKKS